MFIKHFKVYYLLIGCFCFCIQEIFCQDQKEADSLKKLYISGNYKENEIEILNQFLRSEINPDTLLYYSNLFISKVEPDSINLLKRGYIVKEYALSNKGNNVEALQYFVKSLELNSQVKDEAGIGFWGDTVNIASRMESNSETGKINISENTYSIIKDDFHCEFSGKMDVKNKGFLNMYFINNLKEGSCNNKLQLSNSL